MATLSRSGRSDSLPRRGASVHSRSVSGRLALVIGSECDALGELGFVQDRAQELLDTLAELGEWEAVDGGPDPLLDPTAAALDEVVATAFAEASRREATLLLAFIGHGQADGGEDYYLLAKDSPATPNSRTAFHLSQRVRELLKTAPKLDGLVCLIDACEAAEGVQGAGSRWLHPLVAGGGRMELMVASGATNAYDGCFNRTLVVTARRGQPAAGEFLACADLKPDLVTGCPRQTPVLMSFDGVTVVHNDTTDRGLYLVANVVRRGGALAGTVAAGIIDQLTRGVVPTGTVLEAYQQLCGTDTQRLRAVVGPPGAGKSTLVSLLLRPEVLGQDLRGLAVHGAVFLDPSATRETIANTLAAQFTGTIPGFAEATTLVEDRTDPDELRGLDALERRICRPLEACRRGAWVRVLLDGLDQIDPQSRDDVIAAISALTDPSRALLDHLRVIVTVRPIPALTDHLQRLGAQTIQMDPPSTSDLAAFIE